MVQSFVPLDTYQGMWLQDLKKWSACTTSLLR